MTQTYYQMGQYRYNGSDKLLDDTIKCNVKNLDWQFETETSPWYRDFYVSLKNGAFEVGESYYLTFSLPRDLNYALSFALKFIKTDSIKNADYIYSETTTPYQFIKYLEVPRSFTNGSHNSLVCMYKVRGSLSDPNPRTAISNKSLYTDEALNTNPDAYLNKTPNDTTLNTGIFYEVREPKTGFVYKANVLYHNRVTDTYCMYSTDKTVTDEDKGPWDQDNILEGSSDAVLNWKWESDSISEYINFKILVTPRKSGYDGLLFQMKRIQEDGDIISSEKAKDANNQTNGYNIHGRFVDLGQVLENGNTVRESFKVYKMKNLNEGILDSNGTALHRFGIWGHPELMMAIDGEEILIGQSGYYELNDFDVTKICVAAKEPQDAFVLDYQYKA